MKTLSDVTVKLDRDVVGVASQLADRFGLSQKAVIQKAVAEFAAAHANGEPIVIPPRAELIRDLPALPQPPVAPANAEPYKMTKKGSAK